MIRVGFMGWDGLLPPAKAVRRPRVSVPPAEGAATAKPIVAAEPVVYVGAPPAAQE